jgi:hypothetical protein
VSARLSPADREGSNSQCASCTPTPQFFEQQLVAVRPGWPSRVQAESPSRPAIPDSSALRVAGTVCAMPVESLRIPREPPGCSPLIPQMCSRGNSFFRSRLAAREKSLRGAVTEASVRLADRSTAPGSHGAFRGDQCPRQSQNDHVVWPGLERSEAPASGGWAVIRDLMSHQARRSARHEDHGRPEPE